MPRPNNQEELPRLDLVHIASIAPDKGAAAGMEIISTLSKYTPTEQACAIALAFVAMTQRYPGTHPGDILNICENIIRKEFKHQAGLRAMVDYIRNEVS
jgi:hypothetical protein